VSKYALIAAPAAAALALLAATQPATAHAIAGVRVFPVTLTLDDPGVADEATLPQIINQPGSGPSNTTQFMWEWDKTITPTTALIYNHGFDILTATGSKKLTGFENPVITGKWQAYVNADHEFIASLGIQRELPADLHTVSIGGDAYGSTAPTLYFGKGLGDLPVPALRPFAVTGELSYVIPDRQVNAAATNGGSPASLVGGFSVQYSLEYLHAQVKDYGLPDFFNRLIPLVEANYVSPTTAPSGGNPMTLTFAAGAIYLADTYQVGLELALPGNRAAGKNVGYIVQVHYFFDDLFPNTLGKPLFQ
jgi:hypothetical protein